MTHRLRTSDLTVVLNGLEKVGKAFYKNNEIIIKDIWSNSSLNETKIALSTLLEEKLSSTYAISTNPKGKLNSAIEAKERGSMIIEGIKQYSSYLLKQNKIEPISDIKESLDINHAIIQENVSLPNEKMKDSTSSKSLDMNSDIIYKNDIDFTTSGSDQISKQTSLSASKEFLKQNLRQPKLNLPKSQKLPKLSDHAKERKVPASTFSRTMSYVGLTLGMSSRALLDTTRKKLGLSPKDPESNSLMSNNPFFTKENMNKIVDTLCKNRGAALKLGQMLSLQDTSILSPEVAEVFERVRQSADFMPTYQMEKVMREELGENWKENFLEFESKPFAAASIGQVHCAKLLDGTDVAIKIQYPGVARGIESDINSLMNLINLWKIVPEGMFLDNAVAVAKKELKKEVDYLNETEAGIKFKHLLEQYPEYQVPQVFKDLCTSNVLTTELVYGTPVDKLQKENQETRNWVCEKLLKLCLMEIFLFQYMQTDPNWSNFLYNFDSNQIVLLDFGACNSYPSGFVDRYLNVIKAAANQDEAAVLHHSQKLGFLTGYETKEMNETHVKAVMILGEAFACKKVFDFKQQNMTQRIHQLVPTMLKHRLTAPPDETYSLHRKMSGIFLLCTKLGAEIDCSVLFDDVCNTYYSQKKVASIQQ